MALSGITVVSVGLVSDALFLHWLQSLFLSSWGNAFKEQENFSGSWVRFSWQCFQELGRNPTPQAMDGCGTAGESCSVWSWMGRTESRVWMLWTNTILGEEEEKSLTWRQWSGVNCNSAPEAGRALWPSSIPWLLCPAQPSCPVSVRTGCISHLQLHWLILYFLLYCDFLKVLKAIPPFLLAATWNYCRM